MATNYSRGASRERSIVNYHKHQNFGVVRSAGSKGRFDLVAWLPGAFWKAVQVKSTPSDAAAAMRDLAAVQDLPRGTVVEVWLKLRFGWRVWRLTPAGWTVISDGTRLDPAIFAVPCNS